MRVFVIAVLIWCLEGLAPAIREPADSIGKNCDDYITSQVAAGFSGSVLLVRGGRTILDKDYGLPAKLGRHPAFWLASISKAITATAIFKLQEQGKLSLNHPITRYFKEVPEDKRTITIENLLMHSSGLPQSYAGDGIADREKAVKTILALPLKSPIGEGYHYSNDGYTLLAAIVEIASGKSFEQYLSRELFWPARMRHTGFWGYENRERLAPMTNPVWIKNADSGVLNHGRTIPNWGFRGATGLYSDSEDLNRLEKALQSHSILSQHSLEQMWSPHYLVRHDANSDVYHGYGWVVAMRDGKRISVRRGGSEDFGHNGLIWFYENGNAIIVLSNAGQKEDDDWSVRVVRKLAELWPESDRTNSGDSIRPAHRSNSFVPTFVDLTGPETNVEGAKADQ